MGHLWERGMPRPPGRSEVLRETILRHIRWREMRAVPEIYRHVLDDYGGVTNRTVYRHLRCLLDAGEIVRVEDDSEDTFGYIRAKSPQWDDNQKVWV